MIHLYAILYFEFFKIGLFSMGGGYATLPFLYHISEQYHWFSAQELTQMLAISSITPGPVGLNVATFTGFKTAGLMGSIIATTAIMTPSFFMVILISNMLKKCEDNFYMKSALYALRPTTAAMIGAVGVHLFKDSIIRSSEFQLFSFSNILNFVDIKALVLLIFLFILSFKLKRDPTIYLAIGAVAGIVMHVNIF